MTIQPAPLKTPMVDERLIVTTPWVMFFEAVRYLIRKVSGPLRLEGIVDRTGTSVSLVSGSQFDTDWGNTQGAKIVINGVTYAIKSVTSGTALALASAVGNEVGVPYVMSAIPDFSGLTPQEKKSMKGLIFEATDFGHFYRWNGTTWKWAPGELGSGYVMGFQIAPTGVGWALCDGSNVTYAKEDGTTATIALPDLVGTPRYLKFAASVGTNAAVPPTGTVGAASGSVAVDTGANSAASDGHTHSLTMNPDGEPANVTLLPYFRL